MLQSKDPTIVQAFIPVVFLVIFISINVFIFGDSALDGSNQIILILSAAVAAIVAGQNGFKWLDLRAGIVESISSAMSSMLILLMIGALTGTWLLSGVVPAMIYYGLQILNPNIFLFAACIVCIIVSMATGSSWTTAATVGIALIGIGKAMGIQEGMIAGAVLSGAYFGDKMSPLSDTTNLAPAMAGTDLFTHIKYMVYTTVPSITITLVIFLTIGLRFDGQLETAQTDLILSAITEKFEISEWLFLVPITVIFLIVKKVNALPALLAGALMGGVFALIFQPNMVAEIGGGTDMRAMYIGIMKALYGSLSIVTSNDIVTELLHSKGMSGMLGTIWLILSAMVFGGVMEKAGFLKKIAETGINLSQLRWIFSILHRRNLCVFQYHGIRSIFSYRNPWKNVCGYLQKKGIGSREFKSYLGRFRNGYQCIGSLEYLWCLPCQCLGCSHIDVSTLLFFQHHQSRHEYHFCLRQY